MSALDGIVSQVEDALRAHGSTSIVALAGVPATGKSHVAGLAAKRVAGHSLFVTSLQFHSGFSYEDFIEGYRPVPGGFELKDGVLLALNEQALRDPANTYVLLIEELTRANTQAVLGELLTYIEHRDRSFQVPSGRRVKLASNLRVLATYNPLDRTALELDDAVIRRLRIVTLHPDATQLDSVVQPTTTRESEFLRALKDAFQQLCTKSNDVDGVMLPFGHAVFKGVKSEIALRALWDQQLQHLVRRPALPPHPLADAVQSLVVTVEAEMTAHDKKVATPVGGAAVAAPPAGVNS